MNRCDLLLAALAATFVAGCASVTNQAAAVPQDEKTHVTGTRLPARDGTTSATVNSTENKQGITDMMQRGNTTGLQPKGGGM